MGRRREKERSHVISEGKSNQTPGSLTFNTVDFFFFVSCGKMKRSLISEKPEGVVSQRPSQGFAEFHFHSNGFKVPLTKTEVFTVR